MRMYKLTGAAVGVAVVTIFGAIALAQQAKPDDTERVIKEAEVPAAALAALKKLAGGNAISEFSEETEHGMKVYEASWKNGDVEMEAEATEAGEILEIEESVAADRVPAAVRTAAEKEAGAGVKISYERTTIYVYEINYRKDNKGHEATITPDGRVSHEQDDNADGDDDKKK
ncbi:MAG: hypothetical protein ACKVS9_19990 [Phycisphaerae bacterium]